MAALYPVRGGGHTSNGFGRSLVETPELTVYLCCTNRRTQFLEQVYDSWNSSRVNVVVLTPGLLKTNDFNFQRERRVYADYHSPSPFYILADDDCLPSAPAFIHNVVNIMRDVYKEFAILSLWPSNETINEWTPEDYKPQVDSTVMEHVSVGGIRVCRTNCIELMDWPPQLVPSYDYEHCAALRKNGFRTGYYRKLTMKHLGKGDTTVWNQS